MEEKLWRMEGWKAERTDGTEWKMEGKESDLPDGMKVSKAKWIEGIGGQDWRKLVEYCKKERKTTS
jgi:hypothetical protein